MAERRVGIGSRQELEWCVVCVIESKEQKKEKKITLERGTVYGEYTLNTLYTAVYVFNQRE